MSLGEALADARAPYPTREEASWHVAMSHHRRKIINNRLQERAAAKETDKIIVDGETPYHCFAGTKLNGTSSTLKPSVNGAFLLVTKVSPETVSLKDEDTGLEFEVSPSQLVEHTRLRWALTIRSAQGRSLSGTVAIRDVRSRPFSTTHLRMALSRATDGANVWTAPAY